MLNALPTLQAICKPYGVPPDLLRQFIHQWLVLHLKEHHDYETQLCNALSEISQELSGNFSVPQIQEDISQVLGA